MVAAGFFLSAGDSLFDRPREEGRGSEGAVSDPLPDALRARREGGLLAAPRDLDCTQRMYTYTHDSSCTHTHRLGMSTQTHMLQKSTYT